jgi:Flp pilus assembly secretin CpaC
MRTRLNRTRRLLAGCAALIGVAGTVLPQAGALAVGPDAVLVTVDRAKVIRLPERTQTVIVGNPIIADVTLQRNGLLVVTGKSYGVTNLIALDNTGTMLAESLIRVQAPSESLVTVQRGLERESYSCTPKCQPSILLGDANKYFSEVGGQAGQRNSLATGQK